MLYDSSMNPVNVAFITDLPLNAGTGGPGGDEEFTNSWFNTSDSDGDGIADTIKVSWNANTTLMEEDISILALVRDKVCKYGPYTIYTSQLNKGEIEFYAGEIGTYEISLYLIDSNSELEDFDFLEVPLGTSTFTNNYTDYGIDMNADGKYDYLAIDIEIDVITDGNYTLRGILYDRAGNPIMTTTTSTYLTEGIKTVQLNFDGQTIYESEVNGPYELRYLTLYKDGTFIGHRNRPYTTLAYNYREFQPPPTTLNWNLTNPLEVLLDQTFDVVMIVANPSGHTLTNLQASLTLPSELDTTGPLVKDIGNLEPSQTKEIYWILKGTNVGYGEITVNITSPDIQSVSATRDIVVTHFPLSVETDKETYMPGDNVIVTTKLTNNNQIPVHKMKDEQIRIMPPSPGQLKRSIHDVIHDLFLFGKESGYETMVGIPQSNALHNHVLNVALISILIGGQYGFFENELLELGMGAVLHDIGKAALPQIYGKMYWQLGVEEIELYKLHPVLGEKLLDRGRAFTELEKQMIMQHHERQDGQGFPMRLKGNNKPPLKEKFILPNQIFRFAEIIAVADMYDNLISGNYYDKYFSPVEALKEIKRESGTGLNSSIVDVLFRIVTKFPAGTNVRILKHTNKEIVGCFGVVAVSDSSKSSSVEVILVSDSRGNPIPPVSVSVDISNSALYELQVVNN